MWQIVDLSTVCDALLIDTQTIWFNFSAWIGGWSSDNDNTRVALVFSDQSNTIIGNTIALGPVLAADRNDVSSLLFRRTIGLVPAGARSLRVQVTITRARGSSNDGAVDNISIVLYQ